MDIDELQRNWDEFGRTDPLWAILSQAGTQGGRWDLKEFLDTGRREITGAIDHIEQLGVALNTRSALDFGCGVGRLTQALAEHFDISHGVDIADAMIEGARRLNQHGDRVHYHVNHESNLSIFEDSSFDFVYSALVLQHMEPRYATSYLEEFARVLAPGGVAMFQIPSEPLTMSELAIEPLADGAYQARLEPAERRLDVEPGQVIRLKVAVTNTSEQEWPEGRALRVGNHWRSRRGRIIEMDDGREPLSQAVGPGETVELTLLARAPSRRGRYALELDLVQERVTWFADRGSPTVPVDVKVRRRLRRAAQTEAPSGCRPVMEIHGVPTATVHDLLERHSMRVVTTESSDRVSGWRDHLYVAVKTAT